MNSIPLAELRYLFRAAAAEETSFAPENWSKHDPMRGHCTSVVLTTQFYLEGTVARIAIPDEWKPLVGYRCHYVNVTANRAIIDLYRNRFPKEFPYDEVVTRQAQEPQEDRRGYLLKTEATRKRYLAFFTCVRNVLHSNPLFLDEKFQLCWSAAFSHASVCPKVRMGCAAYRNGKLLARKNGYPPMARSWEPSYCSVSGVHCAEFLTNGRPDHLANPGSCAPASLWVLRDLLHYGFSPKELGSVEFFEAAFDPDGSPRWDYEYHRTYAGFGGAYAVFGPEKISLPDNGEWRLAVLSEMFARAADEARARYRAG